MFISFLSVSSQNTMPPILSIDPPDLGRNPPLGNDQIIQDTGILPPPIDPQRVPGLPSMSSAALSMCPNMLCTFEYIPEECAETPVQIVNGVRCKGCTTWKESCKNMPDVFPKSVTDRPREVSCPILSCPMIAIPPGCEYIETFEYLGRKCQKCPVWRSGCTEGSDQTACPYLKCPLKFIHPQCKEVPIYTFMGKTCNGCPQWKKNCNPSVPTNELADGTVIVPEIPQVACPLLVCKERIPVECRVRNTYTVNGKTCDSCPTWKANCKPIVSPGRPGDEINSPSTQRMACPLYHCADINIPGDCIEHQPYNFQGQTCYKCPNWREGCVPAVSVGSGPRKACPLMNCEPTHVARECLEETFFDFEGRQCQGCPVIKPECKPFVRPALKESLDQVLTDVVESPASAKCPLQRCPFIYIPPECEVREAYTYQGQTCYKCPRRRKDCGKEAVSCPVMACPAIYIPSECEEKQPYIFQGRTCYRCPKQREGCIPNSASESVPMATLNEVGHNVNDPQCPAMRCALILIPKECEEIQPYQFNGHTCYGCPKWRKGCSPGNKNTVQDPEFNQIACPLFGCPRIRIPAECKEDQPYNFQGKVCYMCPKWREGCVPKNGGASITNQNPSVIPVIPVRRDNVACPLFNCPKILIPEECKDEQSYELNGHTCFKCPRWRPGCVPSQSLPTEPEKACPLQACPAIEIPSECKEETPYIVDGKSCYGCPKFKVGCIPTQRIPPAEVACPIMACNKMYIPPECKEEHPYEFQGKTCYKCPTLKKPCIPDAGGSMKPRVACPLLDCPEVRIPEECKETKTYEFQGRTCLKCPSWKIGCSPRVPVQLVEKQTPLPKTTASPAVEIVCPVPKCPRIRIPEECKLEQAYQFQGHTCYKCAIWRPGCIPSASEIKTSKTTVGGSSGKNAKPSPPEITPRRLLVDANIAAITCPRLRCPKIDIPIGCQEQTIYEHNGKVCPGCPTWSSRCDNRKQAKNRNING